MSAETAEEVIAPEPEVVPVEPTARHRDEGAETPTEHGAPAGQVALGAISVLAVGGAGLYSATGVAGLVVGGAATVAAGGGYAYHRFRRTHPHKGGRSGSASRHGGASRTSPVRNPLSGLTSRSGRRAAFSTGGSGTGGRKAAGGGRSGLRMPSMGGGGRGGKAGGKRMSFPGGKSAGGGRSSKGGRSVKGGLSGKGGGKSGGKGRSRAGSRRGGISSAAHKVGGAGRKFGRLASKSAHGARTASSRTAGAARTVAGKSRRAGTWINHKTGGRASRAFGYPGRAGLRMGKAAGRGVAKHVRRAGGWVDRRTGRRVSTAWNAMRGAEGFRASRRRGVAVLGGWDAQVTASLLALVALLAERLRQHKARKNDAKIDAKPEATKPDDAKKTDNPAITATAECPRCGTKHAVTLLADEEETAVTCDCGFRIRFVRIPPDAPTETTETKTAEATRPRAYTRRTRTMSGFPLVAVAADLNAAAAGHSPEDMFQVARELDQLGELPSYVALAIRTYTQRLQGDYPIDPAVVDAIHELYNAQALLVSMAEEIGPLFRRVHEADLAREEAPRTNEAAWNV